MQDSNLSINSGNNAFFYQTKITPTTRVLTNNISSASSKHEDSEQLSINSKNYKFSGSQRGTAWSQEEDKLLIDSVRKHECKNWKAIAKSVPGRTATQCSQRWRRIQPYKARQPWTKDEDKIILGLVEKHGCNWGLISSMIEGRTGKQVRERYLNKLDKNINRSKFTEEDDEIIIGLYESFGPKWKDISLNFKGRPENMIKNRFYSHIRKKLLLNPEKYQNLLNSINNDNEMVGSINSSTFNQELPEQKLFYNDVKNEEFDLNNMNNVLQGRNLNFDMNDEEMIEENHIRLIEDCFALKGENNQLNLNYDLEPLTPNYFIENPEFLKQKSHSYLSNQNQDFLSNTEKQPIEEIEFFETNSNYEKNLNRSGSTETKKVNNLKQLEFLNKKHELLEIMKKEVKEQIKISQISLAKC